MGQRVAGACHRPGRVVVGRRLHGRDDDRLGGNRPVRVPSRHQPARSPPRWRRETVDPTPHSSRSAVPAAAHRDPVPPARPAPSPARRCRRSRTRDERPIARSCAGDPAAARRGGRRGHGHVERVAGWATRSPATGRWAADRSTGAIRGRPRTVVAAPAFGLFRGGDVRQFGRGGRRGRRWSVQGDAVPVPGDRTGLPKHRIMRRRCRPQLHQVPVQRRVVVHPNLWPLTRLLHACGGPAHPVAARRGQGDLRAAVEGG